MVWDITGGLGAVGSALTAVGVCCETQERLEDVGVGIGAVGREPDRLFCEHWSAVTPHWSSCRIVDYKALTHAAFPTERQSTVAPGDNLLHLYADLRTMESSDRADRLMAAIVAQQVVGIFTAIWIGLPVTIVAVTLLCVIQTAIAGALRRRGGRFWFINGVELSATWIFSISCIVMMAISAWTRDRSFPVEGLLGVVLAPVATYLFIHRYPWPKRVAAYTCFLVFQLLVMQSAPVEKSFGLTVAVAYVVGVAWLIRQRKVSGKPS